MLYKYCLVLFINLFTFIARFKNIIKKIQLIVNIYYFHLFLELRPLYFNMIEFDVLIVCSNFLQIH